MAVNGKVLEEKYKIVKSIFSFLNLSRKRSPYYELEKKYGLQIDWRPFIHVEGVTGKEFRKLRVRPDAFSAIVFTSKNAVDHFFRICEEMRITMSQETKYFCLTEAIAHYLQKFIVYRKRKVFLWQANDSGFGSFTQKAQSKKRKFLLALVLTWAQGESLIFWMKTVLIGRQGKCIVQSRATCPI